MTVLKDVVCQSRINGWHNLFEPAMSPQEIDNAESILDFLNFARMAYEDGSSPALMVGVACVGFLYMSALGPLTFHIFVAGMIMALTLMVFPLVPVAAPAKHRGPSRSLNWD